MKRYLLLIVSIAVAMAMVFSFIGCGSDTAKAKEYMEKGDELTLDLETESFMITDELIALIIDYIEGRNTEPAAVTAKVEEIKDMASEMESNGEKAKEEYELILGLNGVSDYKEYASMQIEIIEMMKDDALETCYDTLDKIMASVNTGEPLDTDELMESVAAAVKMGKEATEQDNEAEEYKIENNL
ncbi:MAG: hypothetical protein SWK76_01785 [Actinomycetota bacterium]|nr:hypothetical protein [Actinomycetota bacterium]